jgi:xanthine dehydrogenase YagR molybdenum-binding subunit
VIIDLNEEFQETEQKAGQQTAKPAPRPSQVQPASSPAQPAVKPPAEQKPTPVDEPHTLAPKQLPHRYDAVVKVMGKAKYAAEFTVPNEKMAYGYMVCSTIAAGTLLPIERTPAEEAPGVLAVMTFENVARVPAPSPQPPARRHVTLFQDNRVDYSGQPVAYIVAESLDQARYAGSLLKIRYKAAEPKLHFEMRLGEARRPKQGGREPADVTRGDLDAAMAKAGAKVDVTYRTPIQHANPMEPHATIAWWEGEKLNVYDATQYIVGGKQGLARTLAIPIDNVHVECPYTGGGFGSKGSQWSHVALTAMAAKMVKRPVKIALEREQMFGNVGARPETVQHIQLAATSEGKLTGLRHDVILHTSVMEDFLEPAAYQSRYMYATEANVTSHKMVEMNLGVATFHRAPGEAPGTAALECAMDELAHELKMDPLTLRTNSYAEDDQSQNRPWTSKHLMEAYQQASERFGWKDRPMEPGTKREGNELIGYGMATAIYGANRSPSQAVVRVLPNGKAFVGAATQDLGTGMYTIMAQTAADGLSLNPEDVEVKLGDSTLPKAPVSGGSQSAASVCPAITDACGQAEIKLFEMASGDARSPLSGKAPALMALKGGKVTLKDDASVSDSFADLISRNGGKPIEAMGSAEPDQTAKSYSAQSWGAVFVEVAVDVDTHMVKVRRVVATYDIGTLMNNKTGINQLQGGIVWGISIALAEDTHLDETYGRFVNRNLAEYHVPVNADIGVIDVTCLNIPDTKFNPLGARGIGEIGITGAAAAVGNAVFNATGKRVRTFPITPDKLMA